MPWITGYSNAYSIRAWGREPCPSNPSASAAGFQLLFAAHCLSPRRKLFCVNNTPWNRMAFGVKCSVEHRIIMLL